MSGSLVRSFAISCLFVSSFVGLPSLAADKKPLDHSVYDSWRSLTNTAFSNDGMYFAYVYRPQEGDSVGEIRTVADGKTISIPRVSTWQFTADSRYLLATQVPPFLDARKARRDKVKPDDQPKNNLVIVDLAAQKTTVIERVAQWQLGAEGSDFFLYKPEPAKEAPKTSDAKTTEVKPTEQKPTPTKAAETKSAEKKDEVKKKADHKAGQTYILRNLATGAETKIENVVSASPTTNSKQFALSISTADGKGDGVAILETATGKTSPVITGLGHYTRLTWNKPGTALVFSTDKDDYAAKKPSPTYYLYQGGKTTKLEVPKNDYEFVATDFGGFSFSDSGKYLSYPVAPKPVEDKELPDDEKVSVDIWNYKDGKLQPQQLLEQKAERERTFEVRRDITSGSQVLLETPRFPSVQVTNKGDGSLAIIRDNDPYEQLASWDGDYEDIYLRELNTQKQIQIATRLRGQVAVSPTGKRVVVFDGFAKTMKVVNPLSGEAKDVTSLFNVPLFDELDDHPDAVSSYGIAGWSADENTTYVLDRYDIWALDLNQMKAKRITFGREQKRTYRDVALDSENPNTIKLNDLWLTGLDEQTKDAAIYQYVDGNLQTRISGPKSYLGLTKAKNADVFAYRQGDTDEYPEFWLTNAKFDKPTKVTETNPQQKDYIWAKSELVNWRSADGVPLQGILYKPENFDYAKKYPMITYFYERNSDTLHNHVFPAPSASTINIALFVSQGYLVFVPDIPYKIGYPGESAVSAIVSGVNEVVSRGYADPKKLGIQGQSWGGYQVAYLVTETDMFAAAEAGAPVSNMFSAYGGIRYGSGLVRQFQYERQQSRIGGTPWDSTLQYLENSPLFHLPKVKTPLMIMSNDKDGAVPHTQGIELFTGLRRLGKPAWMVVYNDEDHNLVQRKNRKDLSIRLSQFFDHFLKGTPMPTWMEKGLPAVDKGRTMGTEIPNQSGKSGR
jgi:dipeptidyl aminopeptidase/acylaminoacyl peptidase